MLNFRSTFLAVVLALTLALVNFTSSAFAQEAPQKKEWTFLIFLNADNNLERFGYQDMQEMEKVGSNDRVNVVVQFDTYSKQGTPRYLVKKAERAHSSSLDLQSPVVMDLPERDMGDYKELVDFVQWGMETYPAEHYLLIMWNHGNGWKKDDEPQIFRGISYDDTSGNHITTMQFAKALEEIYTQTSTKIDVIAFDACLMAMAEIADTLVPYSNYLVASEELVPGKGMPYDKFMGQFFASEVMASTDLIYAMVTEFGRSYSTGGSQGKSAVQMSALDLSKFNEFKRRMNIWVDTVATRGGFSREELLSAAKQSMIFGGTSSWDDQDYRDLATYVRSLLDMRLAKEDATRAAPGFIAASLGLLDALNDLVVENFRSQKYAAAGGLAIYLPYVDGNRKSAWNSNFSWDNRLKDEYRALTWSKETSWTSHLDLLFPTQ